MEKHPGPWSKGAVFICEKCGRRDDGDPALKGLAEDWKKEFKSRLRDEGHGKSVRVMVSGCLSLCPPDRQVAAWCPTDGKTELIVFERAEKDAVFDWIKKKL